MSSRSLRVAFIHPDLGIGGAERLVVDAALGIQSLGHSVDIYTSHHNPAHCFDETRDGTLNVHHVAPPFPRSVKGKFHILFAHLRQLHLTSHLLLPSAPRYDVYFVDQLSTCIPFLRAIAKTRVVFYCHFPDKLLANGEFVDGQLTKKKVGLLRAMYRYPMDWLEEITTAQADIILANSKFTARVFESYFTSQTLPTPTVVYPGINVSAYESTFDDTSDPDVVKILSDRPTLVSLNRFEKKKNVALAISSFALLRARLAAEKKGLENLRLVIAGGYDPRLEDNMMTLVSLIDRAKACSLTYNIITSSTSNITIPPFNCTSTNPHILFLLNFTTSQRSALLRSPIALLYTPTNEHFGIGPVEGMLCGIPVLACNTGGPTESIIDLGHPLSEQTGWLRSPDPELWADALLEIINLDYKERALLAERCRARATGLFGMDAMAKGVEKALKEAVMMEPVPDWGIMNLLVSIIGFIIAYVVGTWLLFAPE